MILHEPFSMQVHEPTMLDVLSAVRDIADAMNVFATHTEERFQGIDRRFDVIDKKFDAIDQRFAAVDQKFETSNQKIITINQRLSRIEQNMVTKDYLDERLADLRGDLVVLVRKEDKKLTALVDELVHRDVIDQRTAKRICNMEPFAPTA